MKDGVANSEYKLHKLVCDCLSHRYDSCTKGCCRGSNLGPSDPKAGVLTIRPSCSPQCFSNLCSFSKEHIFVGFNEFPSLECLCTVIYHHRPQGPTLFWRMRSNWNFTYAMWLCAQKRDLLFKSHLRRLVNVQLIPNQRGLQQNKRRKWRIEPLRQRKHWIKSPTYYPSATATDILFNQWFFFAVFSVYMIISITLAPACQLRMVSLRAILEKLWLSKPFQWMFWPTWHIPEMIPSSPANGRLWKRMIISRF